MMKLNEKLAEEHLQTYYVKGDVLFWENYPGKEKGRDSYFVLLTSCIGNRFICARATAQVQHYGGQSAKRLQHEIIWIKKGETSIFPKDTVIDLTWIRYFTTAQLSELLGSTITRKGKLPVAIIQRIDNCVRSAVTISQRDQKLILQL